MKALSVTLAITLSFVRVAAAQEWAGVGPSAQLPGFGVSDNLLISQATAVGPDHNPVLGWFEAIPEGSNNHRIHLRRWNGSAWTDPWGTATGPGIAQGVNVVSPTGFGEMRWLALDSQGNPTVTWHAFFNDYPLPRMRVCLRSWNGTAWVSLNGSGEGDGIHASGFAYAPQVAMDGDDRPVVAWEQSTGSIERVAYLKRWTGSAWVELGGSATANGVTQGGNGNFISLALDNASRPVLAWSTTPEFIGPEPCNIHLRRWNGTAWAELGGSANGFGVSGWEGSHYCPDVEIDAAGNPVVAWFGRPAGAPGYNVYVRKWTGSAWAGLGTSANGQGISPSSLPDATNNYPSMVLTATGLPVVSWSHWWSVSQSEASEVYLRRWDGSAWRELDGSASDGGISGSADTASFPPTLARGEDGSLVVAWYDADVVSGERRILLKRRLMPAPSLGVLGQHRKSGGAPIPPGHLTMGDSGFEVRAQVVAEDGSGHVLEAEAAPVGAAFDGSHVAMSDPTVAMSTAAALIDGLPMGVRMRWRVRLAGTGPASWRYFGSDPDDSEEMDVWIRDNEAPTLAGLGQFDRDSGAVIAVGGNVFDTSLSLTAESGDADGDDLRFEMQLVRPGTAWPAEPTSAGAFAPPGDAAHSPTVPGLGAWAWRARMVDPFGGASDWIDFGGNAGTDPDFVAVAGGSGNAQRCGASSAPFPVAALLIAAVLAIGVRRP